MFKQFVLGSFVAAGLIAATSASAANPLDPSFKRYPESTIAFKQVSGSAQSAAITNPLQPGYFVARSSAKASSGNDTAIAITNPLHPSFKRA